MELGEKLRKARLEAKMSQRALCGDAITRNMLSQIENGSARPSMKTLQYLAARLGKPVSFFLEEGQTDSPNQQRILTAWASFDAGNWSAAAEALEGYQMPDRVFDREYGLLKTLCYLNLAEEALKKGQLPYARELLAQAEKPSPCCAEALRRRYLLLLGALGEPVSGRLPSLDEELLLRAREAAAARDPVRAAALLDAVEMRTAQWHLLRGQVYLAQKRYREAAENLQLAEKDFPKETVPQLELVFRELGDYEKAYFYACRRRS